MQWDDEGSDDKEQENRNQQCQMSPAVFARGQQPPSTTLLQELSGKKVPGCGAGLLPLRLR